MTQDPNFIAATRRSMLRAFGAAVVAATLVACGGGGGGGDDSGPTLVAPPTTAATVSQSDTEAMAAVQALNSSTAILLQKSSALEGGSLFAPVGASNSPLNLRNIVARAAREQALARDTVGCSQLGLSACSGSVTFDYNFAGSTGVVPAGSRFTMEFNSLSGSYAGSAFSMSGSLRMDFLTALDINAPNLADARFQLTLDELSGTTDGVSFGPDTTVALYEFDAQGSPVVTIDGLRIDGLDNLVVTDADNYSVPNLTLRRAHWAVATTYVDLQFTGWTVVDGRPAVGSQAAVLVGSNNLTAAVTARSADTVVYAVTLFVNGTSAGYIVTATYPAGGGAPTYTVQPAAT